MYGIVASNDIRTIYNELLFQLSANQYVFNVRRPLAGRFIRLHRCVGSQRINAGVAPVYLCRPSPDRLSVNFSPMSIAKTP